MKFEKDVQTRSVFEKLMFETGFRIRLQFVHYF